MNPFMNYTICSACPFGATTVAANHIVNESLENVFIYIICILVNTYIIIYYKFYAEASSVVA